MIHQVLKHRILAITVCVCGGGGGGGGRGGGFPCLRRNTKFITIDIDF